jgi:hypothetical protein
LRAYYASEQYPTLENFQALHDELALWGDDQMDFQFLEHQIQWD